MENLILITEEEIRACRYNGACRESIKKLISGMPLFEIPSSDLIWVEKNLPHLAKINGIPLFIFGYGDGYGDGDGDGDGYGDGYGAGYGDGDGAGHGAGYGAGHGAGYGDGDEN